MNIIKYILYLRGNAMLEYNRQNAVEYAHRWALDRNPKYLDFDDYGGDCTNFASQVIYAGSRKMNYTPIYGWYYNSAYDRTPSWTGVEFFHNFLIGNKGAGPFAKEVDVSEIRIGDVIQLSFNGNYFQHSPVVVSTGSPVTLDNILISTHTYDRDNYPITNYSYSKIRFIHIVGIR
jgi:hypothetical protein